MGDLDRIVIAAIAVVAGAVFGKTLEVVIAVLGRRRKRIDMVVALHAEILAGTMAATEQTTPEAARRLADTDLPFGPSDRADFVFEALKADLSILPQSVIHSVVRYYRLAEQSNRLVEYLEKDEYKTLPDAGKTRYAGFILDKLNEQQRAARGALAALETYYDRGRRGPKGTLAGRHVDGTMPGV